MTEAADASDSTKGTNPEGGGDIEGLLEKVGALVKENTGLDLNEYITKREKDAAAAAAGEAGQTAQKRYDPKLAALDKQLKALGDSNKELKRRLRAAEIAAMPKEAQEAARKLAEVEDANDAVESEKFRVNEALRRAHAREAALDLRERGITGYTFEDFLGYDSPEEIKARVMEIRAEEAEKRLESKGTGADPQSKGKTPPASSQTPSRGKGGASGAGGTAGSARANIGDKPWSELKGKGLDEKNLTQMLKRMEEEGYTGVE